MQFSQRLAAAVSASLLLCSMATAQKKDAVPNFPGAALMLAVFCFNLLGDGLRDIVDPQRRT